MTRRARLLSFVPMLAIFLLVATHHVSHAQTSGVGWMRRDFTIGDAVGTFTIFDFERLLVREGVQSFQINQTVRVGTGSTVGTMILMANMHNTNVDCGSGASMWQTPIPPGQNAVWINIPGYNGITVAQSSSTHWYQSTNDHNNTAYMRLTMSRKDSCRFQCPLGTDSAFWYWNVGRYTVGGLEYQHPIWPVGITFNGAFPNSVINARHGLYSSNVSPLNDIHADYLHNGYYHPLPCNVNASSCPANHYWGPYDSTRWGSLTCEEETIPSKLMVFERYDDPAADLRGICLGAVIDTPCGCFVCEDNISLYCHEEACGNSSGYLRWKNKEIFPIRWWINMSDFDLVDDAGAWEDAFEEGQEFWNQALDQPVFCRTYVASEADVEIIARRVTGGVAAEQALTAVTVGDPVYFYDSNCSNPEVSGHRVIFVSKQTITVLMQGHYRWVDAAIETENGADPLDPLGEHSRGYVAAHELGHALMLEHTDPKPADPVPTPGTTEWNVTARPYVMDMVEPRYFDSPISWTVSPGQVGAIECALYRRYP